MLGTLQLAHSLKSQMAVAEMSPVQQANVRSYLRGPTLDYPQSGERTRGRSNIQNQRAGQPSKERSTVKRIIGSGNLWITEFVLAYDGKPSYAVSIMEFRGDRVARETQYFADPFEGPAWRSQLVERIA